MRSLSTVYFCSNTSRVYANDKYDTAQISPAQVVPTPALLQMIVHA